MKLMNFSEVATETKRTARQIKVSCGFSSKRPQRVIWGGGVIL